MGLNRAPYPPIVDTWAPAAVIGETIRIDFSLSAYASLTDIRTDIILVDIVNSQNNESVINLVANHGQTQLITNMQTDENGKHFVEIDTKIIRVTIGNIYKVQLRFCSSAVTATREQIQKNPTYDGWREYISDYSTVTLVKIIPKPILELKEFLDVGAAADYIISTASFAVIGKLKFGEDNNSGESLSSYKIMVFENTSKTASDADTLIVDTDYIYPDSKELNTIYYVMKKDLKNNAHYLLRITYITSSGYTEEKDYHFTVMYDSSVTTPPPYVWAEMDEEDGTVLVHILGQSGSSYKGFFILRRTSNLSNFTEWDDLKYFRNKTLQPIGIQHNDKTVSPIVIKDYLVQAGVIYRYQVIPMNEAGYRGIWYSEDLTPIDNIYV